MPLFSSQTDWVILILILLGYELYESNRKLGKIQETLVKILERLEKRQG
jgi:hypothetical protein